MKLILKNVKIYGYDQNIYRTFENDGKETKQYSVALYITDEDKAVIDSYLYNKVSVNQEGENVFYGKSKQIIPIFDTEKKRITEPVNEVFIADVSILIDEFTGHDGESIRYSKCIGIKYLRKVENEQPKLPAKTYTDFDDIFGEEEIIIPETAPVTTPSVAPVEQLPQENFHVQGLQPIAKNDVNAGGEDDLPFK